MNIYFRKITCHRQKNRSNTSNHNILTFWLIFVVICTFGNTHIQQGFDENFMNYRHYLFWFIKKLELTERFIDTCNNSVLSLILDENEIRHCEGHEDNEVHEPLCHMTTNVRLFGPYPVSSSSRRSRPLKWNLFKNNLLGFHSRRHFWS